jgi:hypothetical protein
MVTGREKCGIHQKGGPDHCFPEMEHLDRRRQLFSLKSFSD